MPLTQDDYWKWTARLAIFFMAGLIFAHWLVFPWFLDYFYHLAVVQGFRESGGLVLHEWWEAAPAGRVHLYPPLWHLLNVPLAQAGVAPITLARAWCVGLFPATAILLWGVTRRLFGEAVAAWGVLILATPFVLTVAILNYPTASLATLFFLLAWWGIERGRPLAAAVALGLVGYTHAGTFWLSLLTLLVYGILRADTRKNVAIVLVSGILLASPWLIHQAIHWNAVHLASLIEQKHIQLAPLLFLLAGWGAVRAWQQKGPALFAIAWWIGTLPMLIHYRFRYLTGHGLLPAVMLAGFGAADLWKRGRPWRLALITLLLLWPVWYHTPELKGWRVADNSLTTLTHIRDSALVSAQPNYIDQFTMPLALAVKASTEPDELFACNLPYVAGILSVLSHRATTMTMLGEVSENIPQDKMANARLLVWMKHPSGKTSPALKRLINYYHLRSVGETELAWLFYNPNPRGKQRVLPAVIPTWLAMVWIGMAGGILAWDLARPDNHC